MTTKTTPGSRTTVNGISYKRVAEILRSARDLMNNNGRHWVKGEEMVDAFRVNPVTHKIDRSRLGATTGDPEEYAYCSIGAVRAIVENDYEYEAALFELVKIMNPDSLDYAREEIFYDDKSVPEPSDESLFGYIDLEDSIASVNDLEETQWDDIKNWFTQAAKRAMAKK
jgi:hypothetical protein